MENFDYFAPLEIVFKQFKISGLWQDKNASRSYKVFGFLLHLIGIDIYLFCQFLYLLSFTSIIDLCDLLSVLFTYLGLCIKSLAFVVKIDEISCLIEDLKDLISTCEGIRGGKLVRLKPKVLGAQKVFRVFWASCLVTCTLGGLGPIILCILSEGPPYRIPYKVWAPFDHENNIYGFLCIALYQLFNSLFFCGIMACLDMLPIYFFNIGSGLLEELNDALESIRHTKTESKEGKASNENLEKLEQCIEVHLKIKSFIVKAGRIFSPLIFAQGAMSLIILCTSAFTLSSISPFTSSSIFLRLVTYMIPMMLQIFLPCNAGNEVSVSSEKLSTSLFHSEWEKEDKKFKVAMTMFMENTKKAIAINAADGVFSVNLLTFLRILNSAYSLYAVLQRIN